MLIYRPHDYSKKTRQDYYINEITDCFNKREACPQCYKTEYCINKIIEDFIKIKYIVYPFKVAF